MGDQHSKRGRLHKTARKHLLPYAAWCSPSPTISLVACSGLIWSRYSMVIIPRNLNLVGVNMAMAGTGFYQLSRKIRHDHFSETETTADHE
ncbi:mitochondrial pyruvate carrier 4-like isoform X2 [Punica granatum]|uniref:Mitochondrial pyruvate carrier n=1 Tax=Punica granatum TaxID=22663 RepID=A0A6P8DVY0_PUNGR|nr:mitochondrial pyruvate carrier 4-like isoform X2 [Punica granatum]